MTFFFFFLVYGVFYTFFFFLSFTLCQHCRTNNIECHIGTPSAITGMLEATSGSQHAAAMPPLYILFYILLSPSMELIRGLFTLRMDVFFDLFVKSHLELVRSTIHKRPPSRWGLVWSSLFHLDPSGLPLSPLRCTRDPLQSYVYECRILLVMYVICFPICFSFNMDADN